MEASPRPLHQSDAYGPLFYCKKTSPKKSYKRSEQEQKIRTTVLKTAQSQKRERQAKARASWGDSKVTSPPTSAEKAPCNLLQQIASSMQNMSVLSRLHERPSMDPVG